MVSETTYLNSYRMGFNQSFLQKTSVFLAIVLCVISLQGFYDFGNTTLLLWGIWIISAVMAFPTIMHRVIKQRRFVLFFLFVFYHFVTLMLRLPINQSFNNTAELMFIYSPILMYEIIKNQRRSVIIFFIIVLFIVIIGNVIFSYNYMTLYSAVSMRGANDLGEDFYIVEIAFNMCTVVALLAPVLIDVAKRMHRIKNGFSWNFTLLIAISIVFVVFLINAQFATALLLALMGIVFSFYYKRGKMVRFIIISSVVLIGGLMFIPIFSAYLDNRGDYATLTIRLNEVYGSFTGQKKADTDLEIRTGSTTMSFETFFSNPIFGVNYKLSSQKHVREQGVGNHASWPDSLALYGFFAIFLFCFLYDSLKRQSRETGSLLTMIMVIILGFLNPLLLFPQLMTVFLCIPLIYKVFLGDRTLYLIK